MDINLLKWSCNDVIVPIFQAIYASSYNYILLASVCTFAMNAVSGCSRSVNFNVYVKITWWLKDFIFIILSYDSNNLRLTTISTKNLLCFSTQLTKLLYLCYLEHNTNTNNNVIFLMPSIIMVQTKDFMLLRC